MDAVTGMELGVLYSNITGSFIFSLIFCLLFFRSKEKFLKSLAFFWGFSALSFLAATAIYAGFFQPAAGILYLAGVTAAGVYLLKGTHSFLGENVNKTWFLVGVIGLAAALGAVIILETPEWSLILVMTYLGLAYLKSGIAFIKSSSTIIQKVTGLAAALFAAGTILFPYVFQQEWFIPGGTIVLGGLGTLFGLGLVGSYYENLQSENERLLEEYETIFNNVQSSIFLLDVNEENEVKFQRMNPREEELTGLKTEQVKGKTPGEVLGGKLGTKVEKNYKKCLRKREKIKYEEKMELSGEKKFWKTILAPVIIDGKVEKIVGNSRDITGERMEKLKADALFANSTSAIAMLDQDGNVVNVNEEFQNIFGYELSKIKGENLDDVMEWGGQDYSDREEIKKVLQGQKRQGKKTSYDSKKQLREFLFHGIPIIIEGEVEGAYVLYDDITELKREKEMMEAIFEASEDISFVITEPTEDGEDAIIKEFSPGAENLFGYDREEVINKSVSLLHSDELIERFSEIHQQLDRGKKWKDKVKLNRKNGDSFPAIFTVYPFGKKTGADRTLGVSIDISELEETRKELETTRDHLEAILESIQDGISVLNPDLTIRYTNEILEEWYQENAPLEGKKCYQVYHNRSEPCPECPTLRSLESGEVEKEVVTGLEDSEVDYLELFSYPMIDEDTGEVTGVVEFVRDITERKEMEKQLRVKEQQYRKIFENAPVGMELKNSQGKIIDVNEKLCEITGYEKEELEGESLFATVVPEGCEEEARKDFNRILEGEDIEKTLFSSKKSGENYYVNLKETKVKLPEDEDGVLTMKMDITQRKQLEKEIKEKNNLLEGVLNSIPDIIGIQKPDHTIVRYNKAGYEMLDMSPEEIKGQKCYKLLGREDQCEKCPSDKALKTRELADVEKYIPEYDVYFHCRSNPIINETGEVELIVEQLRDITERKEKENELRYMSHHDDLTDLYNRSFLSEEMERLDTERQLPISFIYCDVNGLKIVNDTYGHEAGDRLLIKVADILRDNTRKEDIVARWAGDEFVILLPKANKDSARKIADRIEEACEGAKFESIPITLGIGIATKKHPEDSLQEVLAKADDKMYKDKLTKTQTTEYKLVQNMLNTLETKSDETEEHFMRMNNLALELGSRIDLSDEQLNNLSLVATLHDIGKATIPEEILTKQGKLTDKEWKMVKEHSRRGYNIASSTDEFAPLARAILYHHERWDGEGYPEGLQEKEIPLSSRIISIVDAYDVMTTGRPYKKAVSKEEALKEIERNADDQFDPELAEKFVKMMRKE